MKSCSDKNGSILAATEHVSLKKGVEAFLIGLHLRWVQLTAPFYMSSILCSSLRFEGEEGDKRKEVVHANTQSGDDSLHDGMEQSIQERLTVNPSTTKHIIWVIMERKSGVGSHSSLLQGALATRDAHLARTSQTGFRCSCRDRV
mmetsp:Transcript_26686/g.78840  ORF Transcript_26686/g.78840 Transcript_26686/m.78840 type:complete len:145 (+) Transcript_26686:1745-2179(+)